MTNKNNPFQKNKKELAMTMNDVGADATPEEVEVAEDTPKDDFDLLIDSIIGKPKPPEKTQVSLYIEPKVAKEFDKFGKKHGKGAKSELVNRLLKKALKVQE